MNLSKLNKAQLIELLSAEKAKNLQKEYEAPNYDQDTAKNVDTITYSSTSNFKSLLERDNKTIRGDRATRIAESARMDYIELINSKKKEIFSIENSLDVMSDLSTSNTTTTSNRIGEFSFDSANFVKRRSDLLVKLTIAKQTLGILLSDASFYESK